MLAKTGRLSECNLFDSGLKTKAITDGHGSKAKAEVLWEKGAVGVGSADRRDSSRSKDALRMTAKTDNGNGKYRDSSLRSG
jgi:hypothetical protein